MTYNGHKNWNYWNVALWIGNDEGLYNLAKDCIKLAKSRREAAREARKRDEAGPGPVGRESRQTTPGQGAAPAGGGTVEGAARKLADLAAAKPDIEWAGTVGINRDDLPPGALAPRGTGPVQIPIPPELAREGAPAIVAFVARVIGLSAGETSALPAVLAVPFGYYGDAPPEEPEDFDPDAFVDAILSELSDLAGELDT